MFEIRILRNQTKKCLFFFRLLAFKKFDKETVRFFSVAVLCSLTYNQRINLCVDCLIISRYQERVKIHFEKLILGDEDVRYSLINPRLLPFFLCVRPFSIFEFLSLSRHPISEGRALKNVRSTNIKVFQRKRRFRMCVGRSGRVGGLAPTYICCFSFRCSGSFIDGDTFQSGVEGSILFGFFRVPLDVVPSHAIFSTPFLDSCLWSEDGVKVYDGGDVQSPVIAHLCGVIHHAEIWSSSPSLLVEFYSSNSSEHTFEGFEARYNFLPATRGSDEEDDIIDDDDEDMEEEEDDLMVDPPGVTAPSILPALITATPIVVSTTPSSTTTRRRTSKNKYHFISALAQSNIFNWGSDSSNNVQDDNSKPAD